jgi:hypothetical protein
VECELTREFGVDWVPRADGRGNEIKGVTQTQMDAYSARTVQVHEKERELAQAWERKNGCAPNSRELYYITQKATLLSRKGKDAITCESACSMWRSSLTATASLAKMLLNRDLGYVGELDIGLTGLLLALRRNSSRAVQHYLDRAHGPTADSCHVGPALLVTHEPEQPE